jgi:hypothetical protein
MWRLLLLLLIASAGIGAGTQRIYRWPAGYEGKQKLEVRRLESSPLGTFGFETEGYRFYANSEIPNEDWRSIMVVCEGLRGAMVALPLDLVHLNIEERERRRGVVRIFADEESYHREGGLEATVGTYKPHGGDVLIWTRGLNEPDPEQGNFRLSKARQYDLLVHELSHQATGREFRRLPTWFTEGVAEYLAAAHYAPGRYSFKDPTESIKTHVKKYLGELAKQDRFGIVRLKDLTAMDGRAWSENTRTGIEHGPFLKYVSAVLLLHYFCHLDPERNQGEVVRNFVGALRDGQPASRAMVEKLLRGRSLEQLEGEIEKFWQAKGLRVEFRG